MVLVCSTACLNMCATSQSVARIFLNQNLILIWKKFWTCHCCGQIIPTDSSALIPWSKWSTTHTHMGPGVRKLLWLDFYRREHHNNVYNVCIHSNKFKLMNVKVWFYGRWSRVYMALALGLFLYHSPCHPPHKFFIKIDFCMGCICEWGKIGLGLLIPYIIYNNLLYYPRSNM